jgi:hypothetical protein
MVNEEPLKQARVVEEGPPAAGVEVVEPLPGYAPELNPVEPLWSNLKGSSWPT